MATKEPKVRPKPRTIREQMRAGIQTFGWCRANQHNWLPPARRGNGALSVSKGIVHVEYECGNCGGKRTDDIAMNTGMLVSRTYAMPDGYVLDVKRTGEVRPNKADWRKEHFKNLIGGNR